MINENEAHKKQAHNLRIYEKNYNLALTYLESSNFEELSRISSSTEQIVKPSIGMTKEEVEKSTWGTPKKVNKTTYSWGTTEQWVYDNFRYVYFQNGIVSAIQE